MLSIKDLSHDQLTDLLQKAKEYKYGGECKYRPNVRYGLIFTEPSTRTYLSFKQAIKNLKGECIYLDGARSSMKKGESLSDTIRMMREYCDIVILRSPEHVHNIDDNSWLINAGDGDNEHPTQALIDLFTIYEEFGLDFDHICIVGDAKRSRTIHSLLYGLSIIKPTVTVTVVSPPGLELDTSLKFYLKLNSSLTLIELKKMEELDFTTIDIFYLTREQKERSTLELDSKYPGINSADLKKMKQTAIILHPLPRGDELPSDIDNDTRASYFKQSQNGVPVRMAICRFVSDLYFKDQSRETILRDSFIG